MRKAFFKRSLAFLLLLAALCAVTGLGWPTAAEARKVKVEVEVDDDEPTPKKKAAPETFPITLRNQSANKVFVALIYYDGNAKNWRCRGWWGVEPKKERYFKLSHVDGKPIYYYVERSGKPYYRSGTPNGVNWNVTKDAFSYLQGSKVKLKKPYKAHFIRTKATTEDGWWSLTIK
jgi:uncharacterized membrane protein